MLTLHLIEGGYSAGGLESATVSIGILNPHPPGASIEVYDFGLQRVIELEPDKVVAVANGTPAAVSFAPELRVEDAEARLAANKAKVIRLKRKPRAVPTNFVTGYGVYARDAALFWRDQGVGVQPLLASGVFALSSIQVPIVTALRLFSDLTPHVIEDALPGAPELSRIVRRAGAGFHNPKTGRPRWYLEFERFRWVLQAAMATGLRDDDLRRMLAEQVGMPLGLGLAKLSFTLALVGNNLGCIDARIIEWAFTEHAGEEWLKRISRKRPKEAPRRGTVTEATYEVYRTAELRILRDTPFYDPKDPVALARAQWMLWESLGPAQARTHTHEELFEAVQEPRLLAAL